MKGALYYSLVALTGVSQAERPQAQVRRSVGNAAQAVLYGVDSLMHQHVCKVKLQNRT